MVVQTNTSPITQRAHIHLETSNKSFRDMHIFLKDKGIKNNAFFLILYDRDLIGIDPRDPRLNQTYKLKIVRECKINFWYFIREVVRIPDQGGDVNGGKPYKLHRGNLALNFGFIMNWNMFLELPRQHGKTISAICWYLWCYLFGTTNSEMMFMNKKHDDSKLNLARLREIRDALPRYLRFNEVATKNGEMRKINENVESIDNPYTHNKIVTKPGARNKANANSIGRGCTMPIHWYDEYAFILHNTIIYAAATPAFSTASANAKRNNAPYGILITTTPGDLTTEEGMDAFETKNAATPFNEAFYDYGPQKLYELRNINTDSSFFYIRFTYIQLGSGEEYFKNIVIDMKKNWAAIRREVLLEWSAASDNSPFTKQDLDIVKGLVKEPLYQLCLGGFWYMDIYKQMTNRRFPPLIGVDVSGGYSKDASAISVVDSQTTDVIGCLNCNYISPVDLSKVIYELVVSHLPNAIVNIERNGGFGASVLAQLLKTKVKRNLYYEIKDRVFEERYNGVTVTKQTKKVKVYGFDETKQSRELLMGILRDRMDNHKSKFISPIIYNELCTLEVKKNGRIEHSSNAHDDQIFSYLMALYVWYEGKDLMERYGLEKHTITTDEDVTVESQFMDESTEDISENIREDENTINSEINNFFKDAANNTSSYAQWLNAQYNADQKALDELLKNPVANKAWAEQNHTETQEIVKGVTEIPMQVILGYYDVPVHVNPLQQEFDQISDLR